MQHHHFHRENPVPIIVGKEDHHSRAESERKYVTVLFSDLCGYTALSQRFDPEELHEMMGVIFAAIDKIIRTYEGFIEKFMGDAVMVLFGVPAAHEDDPARAILAAREIHAAVASLNFEGTIKLDISLSMHSGISSGLLVTNTFNPAQGNYGISGDAINLAARLQGLAQPGEILVCADTFREAQGSFTFEQLSPFKVKGRSEPIAAYRVMSGNSHRCRKPSHKALRGELIGRRNEMSLLLEAASRLRKGKGAVVSIRGDAGTGKSRLVDEFRTSWQEHTIQWFQGYAHAHSRNISYAPFRDLFNGMLGIDEGDPPEMIRHKIEQKTGAPGAQNKMLIPCLGSLYGIDCRETAVVDPEIFKSRLHDAIKTVFRTHAERSPTVICLEDIHWADPSSTELIHTLCFDPGYPALFIFTLRPTFTLKLEQKPGSPEFTHREITLAGLTSEESRELLQSLLASSRLPSELESFILEKSEGNPFYLEEILRTLIESRALVKQKGTWQLTTPLTHSRIPRTVYGLVASRIDSLNPAAKRIIQVASVLGKSFSRTMVAKIIDDVQLIHEQLENLEHANLIMLTSAQPDHEYSFRHTITQEVVYNSLLKKERQEMHERIGLALEELFTGQLEAIPETLAFHFKQGKSLEKAAHYLAQSGRKSLQHYAVNESHRYYGEAYELVSKSGQGMAEGKAKLIALLNAWAPVFYFRGTFKELEELLTRHLAEAEELSDPENQGIFYVWLGASLWGGERFSDAYRFLHRALELGTCSTSSKVKAYAHTWLAWTCVDLGRIGEGIAHGKAARELSVNTAWEHYPYFQSHDSDGYAYWALGACTKVKASGSKLKELGQQSTSIRGTTWGYTVQAWGFMSAGDFPSAINWAKAALSTSQDPLYTQFPRLSLGMCYVLGGDYGRAKELLREVLEFAESRGCRYLGTPSRCFLAAVLTAEGSFSEGMDMLKRTRRWWLENQALWRSTFSELIAGDIYAALAHRAVPIPRSSMVRNIFFLARNLPFAAWKAQKHYLRAMESAHRIGARAIEGQASLSLGRLHRKSGRNREAAVCFSAACRLFEVCEAGDYLEQARHELALMQEGKKDSCAGKSMLCT